MGLSVFQEGDEEDEGHPRNGGQETDAEKGSVAEPFGQKATQDPGQDPADIHQPRTHSEVSGLEIGKARPHQIGDQNGRPQAARELPGWSPDGSRHWQNQVAVPGPC